MNPVYQQKYVKKVDIVKKQYSYNIAGTFKKSQEANLDKLVSERSHISSIKGIDRLTHNSNIARLENSPQIQKVLIIN